MHDGRAFDRYGKIEYALLICMVLVRLAQDNGGFHPSARGDKGQMLVALGWQLLLIDDQYATLPNERRNPVVAKVGDCHDMGYLSHDLHDTMGPQVGICRCDNHWLPENTISRRHIFSARQAMLLTGRRKLGISPYVLFID